MRAGDRGALMDVSAARRLCWRLRRPVVVAAVIALALGFAVGATGAAPGGVAFTSVMLDTSKSHVVANVPIGADSLAWRASLLAHLMADESRKRQLAQELGISPDQLVVVDAALSEPKVPNSLATAAATAARAGGAPYVLIPYLKNESLPIISIEAHAPDREGAARLAEAAAGLLRAQAPPPEEVVELSRPEAEAAMASSIPRGLQGFVVEDVAPVRAESAADDQRSIKAKALPVLIVGLWCGCVAFGLFSARLAPAR